MFGHIYLMSDASSFHQMRMYGNIIIESTFIWNLDKGNNTTEWQGSLLKFIIRE